MRAGLITQAVLLWVSTLPFASAGPIAIPRNRTSNIEPTAVVQLKQDSGAPLCNGHAELCDRKYGNTTFLASHDSFAFSPNPIALARTQEVNVTAQLQLGVRALQAQAHMNGGKLHFCHTSCILFDGGTVEDYLKKVKAFMDANPREVVTLIFTNPENLSVEKVWKPVFNSSGIEPLAYIPIQPIMSRDDWPTLGEMITSGKRLVVFLDKGADSRVHPEKEYILPQFKMMWEDPFDPTSPTFPCTVDRTSGPLLPTQQLHLINHNLNVNIFPIGRGLRLPARLSSGTTNSVESIVKHAGGCGEVMEDKAPNFVMLDFVNVGEGVRAVERLNGF
jgi:hypothetical protein